MKLRHDPRIIKYLGYARQDVESAEKERGPVMSQYYRDRARMAVKYCRIRLHRLMRDSRDAMYGPDPESFAKLRTNGPTERERIEMCGKNPADLRDLLQADGITYRLHAAFYRDQIRRGATQPASQLSGDSE